jgi:RimJ/RimL family protein N-acetyltransferase
MAAQELALRPATLADSDLLLQWRNDPAVRRASRSTARVSADEHDAWLANSLTDSDRLLLIATLDERPTAQVRLDRLGPARWEISVSVAGSARGQGLGTAIITRAVEQFVEAVDLVEAHVRRNNVASIRAFSRAGFEGGSAGDEFVVLSRRGGVRSAAVPRDGE